MMRRHAVLALVLLTALCLPALADDDEGLTLEKIFSPEFRAALGTPDLRWLSDGTVLLYDKRVPEEERTLERLDPRTGGRTPALDTGAALASLAEAMDGKGEEPPDALGWPDVIYPSGRHALYLLEDDLFLLDLVRSSVRRLTRTPEEETCPSFSPDGALVAFVRDNDLYLYDLARGTETALTEDGSDTLLNGTLSWIYWEEIFGREDGGYWWSPDSAAIAFLQSDESMVDVSVFTDFEPATPRVIRQRYPKAGSANPEVRLGVVSLGSGEVVWTELPKPAPEYLVRVVWLPDGSRLSLQTLDRAQQNLDLWLVAADGTAERVLRDTSVTRIQLHDDLHFLAGGRRFLWTSERDGFNRVYLHAIDGTELAAVSPTGMMVRGAGDVDPFRGAIRSFDEKAGWVWFTAQKGSPAARRLYRVRLDGSGLELLGADSGTHRVELDPSASHYLDRYSDISTPSCLFLYRADGVRLATVTPPATGYLAPFDLVTPELATFTTGDGVSLPIQFTKPRNLEPGRRVPVVIYVYGGPSAPSVWDAWDRGAPFCNILLEHGYACASADNRSATARSKAMEATSHRRMMSAFEVPDLLAAVEWLKRQPWVDGERIGIWGWSGGGTFALQLMTHSDAFKAGVAVAAVTDFRYYDTVWTEAVMGMPEDNPEGYEAGAPANFADELSGRLLLVHGTYDDNVHPQNAWRFMDALIEAGITFDAMIYPMQKHGIVAGRQHLYQTMLEFWKRNL